MLNCRCLILRTTALVILPICLAAASQAAEEPLQVGVARVDVTPPLGYAMSGYFRPRGAEGMLDPLEAKAMVFRQGDQVAAICSCDIIGVTRPLSDTVRLRVAEETGIPAERLILAATHSHTGPAYASDLKRHLQLESASSPALSRDGEQSTDYPQQLIDGVVEAVVAANRALAPASLEVGEAEVETVSFNRRFILKDGTVRTWARLADPDVVRAAGPIDPGLDILAVRRPGENSPSAALAVFALHLDTVGGTKYSADYPHHMEELLRAQLGESFSLVFGAGTCGDINHNDPTGAPRNSAQTIGETLGEAFCERLASLAPVQPKLSMASRYVDLPLQPATEDDLAWAKRIVAQDRAGEKLDKLAEVKAYKLLYLDDLHRNPLGALRKKGAGGAGQGDGTSRGVVTVEVQAIRLADDVAIVSLPGEVFVELGLEIQRQSPFSHTMVVELAQSNEMAYIATRAGYRQGGYEPTNSALAAGAGEELALAAVELLQQLQ